MIFKNRETQFPGKKKIIKVDANNVPLPGEAPILVNVYKDEGSVYAEGTPINAENLNKGNWRDDESLSFKAQGDNNLPAAKAAETQIITKANGETWLVPPAGLGIGKKVAPDNGGNVPHAETHLPGGNDIIALGNGTKPGLSLNNYTTEEKNRLFGMEDSVLRKVYPVGSIYISVNNVNPNTTFGFGTWDPFGSGRTLVGVDTSQNDFNAPLKTSGQKTVALTESQMPSHNHNTVNTRNPANTANKNLSGWWETHINYTAPVAWKGHLFAGGGDMITVSGNGSSGGKRFNMVQLSDYDQGGGTGTIDATHMHTTDSKGSGSAHDNMPPYITVYMWRRTA